MRTRAELIASLTETRERIEHWRAKAKHIRALANEALDTREAQEERLLEVEETAGEIYQAIADFQKLVAEVAGESLVAAGELGASMTRSTWSCSKSPSLAPRCPASAPAWRLTKRALRPKALRLPSTTAASRRKPGPSTRIGDVNHPTPFTGPGLRRGTVGPAEIRPLNLLLGRPLRLRPPRLAHARGDLRQRLHQPQLQARRALLVDAAEVEPQEQPVRLCLDRGALDFARQVEGVGHDGQADALHA